MSQAFVKEEDEQWLHDVSPTLHALINYLTQENNGIRVYAVTTFVHPGTGDEIHRMSNGMDYKKTVIVYGNWFFKLCQIAEEVFPMLYNGYQI